MFRTHWTVYAALTLASLGLVSAKPPGHVTAEQLREKDAEKAVRQLRALAKDVSLNASRLKQVMDAKPSNQLSEYPRLEQLKTDINEMGRQITALQNQAAVMPMWEQTVLRDILPALRDAARNTELAITYSREHAERLWAPQDRAYPLNIIKDADQISSTLGNFLKYHHVLEQESQLAAQLPSFPAQ